jgi:hypothetical protein
VVTFWILVVEMVGLGKFRKSALLTLLPYVALHCLGEWREYVVSDHSTTNRCDEYVHCTTGRSLQELLQAKPGRGTEAPSSADRVYTHRRAHARTRSGDPIRAENLCVVCVLFGSRYCGVMRSSGARDARARELVRWLR